MADRKKWCRLCLVAVTLLWMQLIALIPQLQQIGNWKFELQYLILFSLSIIFIASLWLAFKSLLNANKEIEKEDFSNLRFKNNPDVFAALLQKQKKVDTTPFENDLQIGNADSPLQIVVACNPYCGPCAKAHKLLEELVEKNDIGLVIRFAIRTENKEERKLQAVQYLLQLSMGAEIQYKERLFHNWYEKMDLDNFKTDYPLSLIPNVEDQLKQHERWTDKADVAFTPTIFINGYKLPKQYKAEDLKKLIKNIDVKETTGVRNNYAPALE